jgi:hypothetical protein
LWSTALASGLFNTSQQVGGALFMAAGLVLLIVLLRARDVAAVRTDEPIAVGA